MVCAFFHCFQEFSMVTQELLITHYHCRLQADTTKFLTLLPSRTSHR